MEYIKLNNGVEMPALGFGTYKIEDEKECIASIRAALDAGYRLFDTARFYQNESFIGKALAESGVEREKLFLTTKLWPSEFEESEAAVEDSLKQLGTSYLDLVLLHWPYGNIYKAWRALEKLNESGVIRAIGVSNFNSDRLIDLIAYNRIVPAVNQVEANVWCQRRPEAPW
ncbi:MAG: aldo/keto reductase, partial [Victivallales bacterium]|nr:aldo/keto reductase [Victivallales bacterium]